MIKRAQSDRPLSADSTWQRGLKTINPDDQSGKNCCRLLPVSTYFPVSVTDTEQPMTQSVQKKTFFGPILDTFSKIPLRLLPIGCLLIAGITCMATWKLLGFSDATNLDYNGFYRPVAENILSGKGITLDGKLATAYPPGYPLIIAGVIWFSKTTGCSELAANKLLCIICFMAGSLLFFFSARCFWGPRSAAIAAGIWSCLPLILYINKQVSSEHPFIPVFYGCLLLFFTGLRGRRHCAVRFLASGALCGSAMLIRPIAIGLGLVLAALLLAYRPMRARIRALMALCLLAGTFAAVLPWEALAYHRTGEVIQLCKGRDSYSIYDGLTFALTGLSFRSPNEGVAVPRDVRRFMEEVVARFTPSAPARELFSFVAGYARQQPFTIGKLLLIKAGRSWYGTMTNTKETAGLAMQIVLLSALALAWWRMLRQPALRYPALCCLVLVCYFWALTISVLSTVRYMMPMIGFCIALIPALWHERPANNGIPGKAAEACRFPR
jgi:hypothetical protein